MLAGKKDDGAAMQVRSIPYAATLTLLALQTSSTSVTEGIDFFEPGRGGSSSSSSSSSSSGTASRLDPTNPSQRVDHEDMTTLSSLSVALRRSSRNLAGEPGHLHSSHDGHHHHGADVSTPESAPRIETAMIGHHIEGRTHDDVHQHEQPYSYFTMHLPGFRSSWSSLAQSKERVTYLGLLQVRGFATLLVAVLLSFGLSFGLEYVTSRRQRKQTSKQGSHQQQHQMNRQQQRALTAHHGIISLLSHVAMLVAMTYSLELVVALVVGHMAGYYLCHSFAKEQQRSSSQLALEDDRRRRQSPQAQHTVISRLQRLWRNRFVDKGSSFRLLSFPAARERIRRQAYPERSGRKEVDATSARQHDDDTETAEGDESMRDEDEAPLLRKRETKR